MAEISTKAVAAAGAGALVAVALAFATSSESSGPAKPGAQQVAPASQSADTK